MQISSPKRSIVMFSNGTANPIRSNPSPEIGVILFLPPSSLGAIKETTL